MNDGSSSDLDLGQTIRGFAADQKLFGRFSLVRILGRGGMGVVWLARDEDLGRDVALKFLPELIIHDKAVLDDLKRETTRSLELTHHNIVRIYDFANDGQSACISMEYVDGETLSALRIDRPNKVFEVEELSPIIEELCEALAYAHTRASIVHRDLKPANLMLTSKRVLKITDFGIARSLSDSVSLLTNNRGASGTLLYMSPQQLDGERATTLDDIYSVGATIYELLTSKPPFYTGSVERQVHEKVAPSIQTRRTELSISSDSPVPKEWEEAVRACLAKHPTARPQSASELWELLTGIKQVAVGSAMPAGETTYTATLPDQVGRSLEPQRHELKRRIGIKLGILGLALTVLTGTIVGWTVYYAAKQRSSSEAQIAETRREAEEAEARRKEQEQVETKRRVEMTEAERKEEAARIAEAAEARRKEQELAEAKRRADLAEAERIATAARIAEEAEARRKEQEQLEAKRRADVAAEAERKAEERRKAEEARIAKLPKTITVPLDEATISAAMIRAKKGDTIKVRPGTYEDQIVLKDGVILSGAGHKTTTVRCDADKPALTIWDCKSGTISGITFEHGNTAAEPKSSYVIYIANSHVEISNCRVQKGGGFGIAIQKGASPVIHDCIVAQNALSGIVVSESGTKPRLKANQFRENGESGVYFWGGSAGIMEKNQCEANQNGVSVATDGTSVTLRSNQFSRNRYSGIWFSAGSGGLAEDNQCEANRTGISVQGSGTKPTLISNHCRGNTEFGIMFSTGSAGTAEKNKCEGNPTGIYVGGTGTSTTITGNHCFGNRRINGLGGIGLTFDQGATGSVLGNACENNEGAGIWVANGASPSVRNNICRTNGQNGLEFRFASTGGATDNTCERNVGHGIAVFDQGTSPDIWGNNALSNSLTGIYVGPGASPRVGQNTCSGNGRAPVYYENAPQ